MYSESKDIINIDVYRPQMMLRSSKSVKMHHRFTKFSKIKKKSILSGAMVMGQLSSKYSESRD